MCSLAFPCPGISISPALLLFLVPWPEGAAGELLPGLAATSAAPPRPPAEAGPQGILCRGHSLKDAFLCSSSNRCFFLVLVPLAFQELFHVVPGFVSVYLKTIEKALILNSYFLPQTFLPLQRCPVVKIVPGSLCAVEDSTLRFPWRSSPSRSMSGVLQGHCVLPMGWGKGLTGSQWCECGSWRCPGFLKWVLGAGLKIWRILSLGSCPHLYLTTSLITP